MQVNDTEKKRILDEGMLTRTIIENEVALRKCQLYSELAGDPTIKAFFKEQAKGLEDVMSFVKKGLADLA